MKKAILIMIFGLLSTQVFAAEETLFSGDLSHGGFGGPVVKFSQVNGENSVLVGGRGGWIINHSFIIGGGGCGLVNKIKVPSVYDENGNQADLVFGYGGLELEYIGRPNNLVHYSMYVLLGGGGISNSVYEKDHDGYKDHDHYNNIDSDVVWVVEPALNVTLNVTSFFRISAGAGYRYVTGANLAGTSNSDLSNTSFNLSFRFGKF